MEKPIFPSIFCCLFLIFFSQIVVIDAIRSLCERYPRKHSIMMSFLATMLRDDGGYDYKKSIVDTVIFIIEGNPDAKEAGKFLYGFVLRKTNVNYCLK